MFLVSLPEYLAAYSVVEWLQTLGLDPWGPQTKLWLSLAAFCCDMFFFFKGKKYNSHLLAEARRRDGENCISSANMNTDLTCTLPVWAASTTGVAPAIGWWN